jgi:uncharacterized protein (DUF1786 family)
MPSRIAVAVQDHGFSPLESNRLVRFNHLSSFLEQGGRLLDRVYEDPPKENSRMWAVKEAVPQGLLMDTGTAAILGALLDKVVASWCNDGVLVANLGNAHTLAAVIKGDRVLALYEHHTSCLDAKTLGDQLDRFARGKLGHEEVFEGTGHGVTYVSNYSPPRSPLPLAVTGPQRALARDLECHMASPFGDMMLSGCFGLLEGAREKWNIEYALQA